MTNEEAIIYIKSLGVTNKNSTMYEALDMAIKALEQTELNPSYNSIKTELQPCEDCISREALINEMKLGYFNKDLQEGNNDPCVVDAMIDWAIRAIKSQPSVTPTRPKGKWKPLNYKDEMWGYVYECSNCGAAEYGDNYCPNCGAKMEVEENG